MAVQAVSTCADCYFRRAALCALATNTPCPTFRPYTLGSLASYQEPRRVPRSLAALARQHAAV
jgi:hypothetical protein